MRMLLPDLVGRIGPIGGVLFGARLELLGRFVGLEVGLLGARFVHHFGELAWVLE